jgi:transcriptional regulator with XRE-family HTH domain
MSLAELGTKSHIEPMGRPVRSDADRLLMKQMGERLRWIREALGNPSQEKLATLIGVHQTSWSLYERGLRWPDAFEIVRIISKLKISREYLVEGRLDGVERDLAIRLAAAHPELVRPIDTGPHMDTDQS